jgi:nitrous oxidase accessory protein NosD
MKILTFVIAILFITPFSNFTFAESSNFIIYVDDDGTADYVNIQDAINNASEGDLIYVYSGIYYETILIDKKLKLQGQNINDTIIDGSYNDKIVKISADNVYFKDFTVKNSGGFKNNACLYINSNNVTISNCIIFRSRTGLIINEKNNINIINCLFHTNGEGIWSKNSYNLKLQDSELCHNGIGVNIHKSKNIIIENSYAHENAIPFLFNTSSNIEMKRVAACDNNDNGGGVFFYNSYNVQVENCNALHSGSGFKVVNSTNLNFNRCTLENITHFTFWIDHNSNNININECNIRNNFRHGIHITDSICRVEKSNLYGNSIESAFPRNSIIYAKNNFWGSMLGPKFSNGFRSIDRFSRDYGEIIYFPWSLKEYENAGADWRVEENFEKTKVSGYGDNIITLPGDDTDNDGLPDWWEEEFQYSVNVWDDHFNLDVDGDALNNFEECYAYNWGAKPNIKDVFVEIDITEENNIDKSNKLPEKYVEEMKEKFAEHGIILHIDQGALGGGEEIPYITNFSYEELVDIYWNYFLHNDLNNPRKNIFHYGIICDVGPGNGFMFTGWAHLNAFCISADVLDEQNKRFDRGFLISAGSMHELGHTLGLIADDFEGIDNHANIYPKYREFWKYINYKSVMSYQFTYRTLDYSDGDRGPNDFDDWGNMQFDFFKNTNLDWPKK